MNKKRTNTAKKTIFIICLALCMVMVAGTTLAYLLDKTEPVNNTFNPSKVTVAVTETFNGTTKSNVNVKNTGDINAYLRAKVLVNWAHVEEGETEISYIRGDAPVEGADKDYTITFTENSGWFLGSDGFYYYSKPVAPGTAPEKTLISSVSANEGKTPEGYTLYVEILAQGIQADGEVLTTDVGVAGTPAVTDAWGITVVDGKLTNN